MKTILQVALDLLNEHRALTIAQESINGGADWLEVGTPLIKSEGMGTIRKLKELFPKITLVADMKTMDTGALETEMAAKAGAEIICILSGDSIPSCLLTAEAFACLDFIFEHTVLVFAKSVEVAYKSVLVGALRRSVGTVLIGSAWVWAADDVIVIISLVACNEQKCY